MALGLDLRRFERLLVRRAWRVAAYLSAALAMAVVVVGLLVALFLVSDVLGVSWPDDGPGMVLLEVIGLVIFGLAEGAGLVVLKRAMPPG